MDGVTVVGGCAFSHLPRRSGWQFEQQLFIFLHEQFLQRPLALQRQHILGIFKPFEQNHNEQVHSNQSNSAVSTSRTNSAVNVGVLPTTFGRVGELPGVA